MKKKKILLVNTQFVERYISGFTNRFIGLWCHVEKNKGLYEGEPEIHWLTNRTLWRKHFGDGPVPRNVTVISADLRYFKYTSRLFYPFFLLWVYYRNRCTSVHLATSIIKSVYLLRLFRLFRIPHCITFASNSIDMAAYQSERMRKHWQNVFNLARHVDVLNPTNSIQTRGKKHVSPSSFPYMMEFNNIPVEKFVNPNRKPVIIFCGSFVDQKNPVLAVEGFEMFLKDNANRLPEVELWMFGKGDLLPVVMDHLKRTNEKFGREAIRILPDTQLIESLSVSKVFLSLQDYDNYPSQAVMESMLFCNSVLSIDNGDTKKLVREDKGNLLIREKDPLAVAAGIRRLLDNWELNKDNRELILSEFSAKRFTRYFFDLHRSISS